MHDMLAYGRLQTLRFEWDLLMAAVERIEQCDGDRRMEPVARWLATLDDGSDESLEQLQSEASLGLRDG